MGENALISKLITIRLFTSPCAHFLPCFMQISDFPVSSVPFIRWFHCLEVSLLQFGVAVLLLLTYVLVWKFLCCITGSLFHPAFKFVTAPSSIQGRSFHLVPRTTGEFIILLYSRFASRIRNDFMIQLLVYKGNSRKNLIPKEVQ